MNDMKENIKIGLLGLIALVLIINTFTGGDSSSSNNYASQPSARPVTPKSNLAANNPTSDLSPDISTSFNTNDMAQQNQAPAEPAGPPTSVTFGEASHDFGNIVQDSQNKHVFKFTNTGANPLIINNARGSCGCTVPNYPKEPIPPGGEGEIEVVYSPGKQEGNQTKTVTITANTEPATTTLNISAFVEKVEG